MHLGSSQFQFEIYCEFLCGFYSEKLEKAGTVDFKKHPARKVGTRSRQCGPKVSGRFAFPGARNPRICQHFAIREKFSSNFPAVFPELSCRTPAQTPETATAFSSFLINYPVFSPSKKALNNPPKIHFKIHWGICSETSPSDFCRSLVLAISIT